MQYKSIAAAALLSFASVQATNVHVINVGANPETGEPAVGFFPDKITAAVGDAVQFQFWAGNHTVTQSSFDSPCQPIVLPANATGSGIFSGFQPVAASASMGMVPTFTIMINDTTPKWLYCSTGPHCQNGMSMVINENTAANSTRSLANYKNLAEGAPTSGVPSTGAPGGGVGAPGNATPGSGAPGGLPGSGTVPGSPAGSPIATPPPSAGSVTVAGWSSVLLAIGSAMLLL
ncbi:hypothetical protein B0I35DRAFT_478394 [Stachybotrys elegans]|uniref:Phytocyanin domain-containing protein n=1 Tax=Stachybotrys elegans TaxID=80388 RepID=A0A8K0SQV5_9HYPO|nr:hypothetical protein B0I35DRAFT_478394 [Stachybotrys elegans]